MTPVGAPFEIAFPRERAKVQYVYKKMDKNINQ